MVVSRIGPRPFEFRARGPIVRQRLLARIDRAELRRRNFIPLDAFPYKTPTLGTYEASDFNGCMTKALQAADWDGFAKRRDAARQRACPAVRYGPRRAAPDRGEA